MPTFPTVSIEVAFPNGPWDGGKTWTNLASRALSGRISAGRRREYERFAVGEAEIVFDNHDGALDPLNTAGTYYGSLTPRKPVRIKAVWDAVTYDLFYGFVEDWTPSYRDDTITLRAHDFFGMAADENLSKSPYALEVEADSPRAWWKLDESSGSTFADSAQDGWTMHLAGTGIEYRRTSRPFGAERGIALTGATALGAVGASGVSGTNWTVEATFQRDSVDSKPMIGTCEGIYSQQHNWQRFGIVMDSNGTVRATHRDHSAMILFNCTSTARYDDGVPHLATATYDGTTFALYVDGVVVSSQAPVSMESLSVPQYPVSIGTLVDFTDGPWKGGLLDVLTFNSASTLTRVAERYAAWSEGYGGENTGTRVDRVLDLLDFGDGRSLDTGISPIQGTHFHGGGLAELQKIEDTEFGELFVTASGVVRFRNRHARLKSPFLTSHGTFKEEDPSNASGDMTYTDLVPTSPGALLRNVAEITREGGATTTHEDSTSVGDYGRKTFTRTTQSADPNEAADAARWIVDRYKDPRSRFDEMTVSPYGQETAVFPHLLGRAIGDRITALKRTPTSVSTDVHIEGYEHTFTGEGVWVTKWILGPAEPYRYWVLGDATYGVLGSTTRLAF